MLRSLTSAISGLRSFQAQMDVIGNNIANVNTIGYKTARTDLADSFSQTLRESSASSPTAPGVSSMQIGSGINTSAIKNTYTQGAMNRTGVLTDLMVEGEGFFIVKDPVSNEVFVTRSGDFRVDATGYLVTNSGQRVQGYTDSTLATIGDIQINADPATTPVGVKMVSAAIDTTGTVKVKLDNGSEVVRGQVLLQNFNDPQGLVKRGNNLYSGMAAAGPISVDGVVPGQSGTGRVISGALELSNVDLAQEFSTMITAQRAFQATARIITTSDEMLQELVNLKR